MTSNQRVLVFSRHSSSRFTGGRYHSWMMCEALAASGRHVCVVTNEHPLVAKEFAHLPDHNRIQLIQHAQFDGWRGQVWDVIIVVPDLSPEGAVFGAALDAHLVTGAPLVFLDFESPSWFNAHSPVKRGLVRTLWWQLSARHATLIVSSTEYGSREAERYYRPIVGRKAFVSCPPSINDSALPATPPSRVERVVCITRLDKGTRHKGAAVLENLADWLPADWILTCIGALDLEFRDALEHRAASRGVRLECLRGISDREKYAVLASSRLMVFASLFEGFGLPPIEAAVVGTPCVAIRLPVLEETVGNGIATLVPPNDSTAMRSAVSKVTSADSPVVLHPNLQRQVIERYSLNAYKDRLEEIVGPLSSRQLPLPRRLELKGLILVNRGWRFLVGLLRGLSSWR